MHPSNRDQWQVRHFIWGRFQLWWSQSCNVFSDSQLATKDIHPSRTAASPTKPVSKAGREIHRWQINKALKPSSCDLFHTHLPSKAFPSPSKALPSLSKALLSPSKAPQPLFLPHATNVPMQFWASVLIRTGKLMTLAWRMNGLCRSDSWSPAIEIHVGLQCSLVGGFRMKMHTLSSTLFYLIFSQQILEMCVTKFLF